MQPEFARWLDLLRKYRLNDEALLHSLAVTDVAMFFARAICDKGAEIDLDALLAMCVLHDIGKGELAKQLYPGVDHALASARVMQREGLAAYAEPVRNHMVDAILQREQTLSCWESRLLWYADKSTLYRYMGASSRMRDLMTRHSKESDMMREVLPLAEHLEAQVYSAAGKSGMSTAEVARLLAKTPAGYIEPAVRLEYRTSEDAAQAVDCIAAAGFREVAIERVEAERFLIDTIQHAGLKIVAIRAPSCDILRYESAIDDAVDACELASSIGTPLVVLPIQESQPYHWQHLMQYATTVHDRSHQRVKIGLELRTNSTDHTVPGRVIKELGSGIGLSHSLVYGALDKQAGVAEALVGVYASDSEDHRTRLIPKDGRLDWCSFTRAFASVRHETAFIMDADPSAYPSMGLRSFYDRCFYRAQWLLGLSNRQASPQNLAIST